MRRRKRGAPGRLAGPLLLAASVALMCVPSAWVRPARVVLLGVTYPIEFVVSGAVDGIAKLPDRLRGTDRLLEQCRALTAENRELATQVDYLHAQLLDRDKLIAQFRDLKRVLPATGYDVLPAQIIGRSPVLAAAPGAVTFTLGIGSDSGVRRDDLAVTGYAVVGRVISVSPGASLVQALTAPEFRIAARTSPEGVESVLRGGPSASCQLNYVDARAKIKPGDFVVTSGFEGRQPPGLLLGTVEKVQTSRNTRLVDVIVKPAADFSTLNQVIIVRRTGEK